MSDDRYWDNEVFCPNCGRKGAATNVVPEHRRVWPSNGEPSVVHHMPVSKDRRCTNCDHEWTDYSGSLT